MDGSAIEDVLNTAGGRSENRTLGLSNGLLGGDRGSMGGGGTYAGFADCVGDGGVFVDGGDEVELDLFKTSPVLVCFSKVSTTMCRELARLGARNI
jgi:hypothetical protein